jgi:hypothetical protein
MEVASQLVEAGEVPKDFRDFVKAAGQFRVDRPAK